MTKYMANPKMKIKRGDTVRVLLGKDRNKKGKIMAVLPKEERVLVEGVNMVKKHVKARRGGQKGQRIEVAAPVKVSNVQLVCPNCKKSTRIGMSRENNERHRMCKKCNMAID